MDLIILLILIAVVIFWTKDFKFFIYFLGITELFFRLMHFIADNVKMVELTAIIREYIPASIFNILAKYSNGLFYEILCWALFAAFVTLEVYLVKYFIKGK